MAANDYEPAVPKVYTATIIEVDPEAYTVRFFSKQQGITMPIEIPSMFTNTRGGKGGGMHVMPEVGSEVWLCETSDGGMIPLSYHGVIGDGTYANDRPLSLPGDIVLSTTHGNSFKVLKGGSLVAQASPTCSTVHDAMSDTIRHFSSEFARYSLSSKEEHFCDATTRNTQSILDYFFHAEDTESCASITVGSENTSVYKLSIKDRDSNFSTTFTTDLFANGDGVVVGSDLHIDVELCTVGAKASADFVVNSTQFLADLNTILVELSKVVGFTETMLTVVGPLVPPPAGPIVVGTPQFIALVPDLAPLTNMINSIAASVYPTNKLKSE